jgi:hypothetical protein
MHEIKLEIGKITKNRKLELITKSTPTPLGNIPKQIEHYSNF